MAESGDDTLPMLDHDLLRELETPCYVYDPLRIVEDYTDLRRLLGTALIVSIKANPDPGLLARCIPSFRDGIELASQRELDAVRGREVRKFVNTPGMTADFLRSAVAADATLVLDNLYQVDLAIAASRARTISPPMLRLNAGELVPDMNRRGLGDRFGMSRADLLAACTRLRNAGIGLRGIHVFAGSLMFARAASRIAESLRALLPEVESAVGQRIEFLNLGGGIPPEWRSLKFDFRAYRESLAPLAEGRVLAHEAGRAVFTRCGAFVTRVLSRKLLGGHHVVACDGGMVHSFQLAQTELPVKLPRTPRLAYAPGPPRARAGEPVLFVGNTCNNVDRIGRAEPGVMLPEPGDCCIFPDVGAYFATYTLAGFLGIAPARVYLMPGVLGRRSREGGEPEPMLGGSALHALPLH